MHLRSARFCRRSSAHRNRLEKSKANISRRRPAVERLEPRVVLSGDMPAAFPYFQGFEDGTLDIPHWTFLSEPAAEIEVLQHNGRSVMRMDNPGLVHSQNQAILTIDLAGQTGVKLIYEHISPGNDGYPDRNGVFVSDDQGANWHQIEVLDQDEYVWSRHEIDLDAAIANAGLSYVSNFQIAFRQYDNWIWHNDGRQFDNIRVTNDSVSPSVIAVSPAGSVLTSDTFDHITFTFSEAVDPASFDLSDVTFAGPDGDLSSALIGVQGSGTDFTVLFQPQSAIGSYTMTIGPNILDLHGNPMDQNGNGVTTEPGVDAYTVVIGVSQAASLPFVEDFSNGLSPEYWHSVSHNNGRIQIIDGELLMDTSSNYALNELVLHLNLAGASGVQLELDHYGLSDEQHTDGLSVGDVITSSRNADLIAISDNGGNSWYVIDILDTHGTLSFNLDDLVAAAGMSYVEDFLIKFQQFDNAPYPGDGRKFDNIHVSGNTGSDETQPVVLTISLDGEAIFENGGAAATTATITRAGGDLAAPLTVDISVSDPSEVFVVSEAVIPANETTITLPIAARDDDLLDGTQSVTIQVSAGSASAVASLDVLDHETLTISVDRDAIWETAGLQAAWATVTRSNTDLTTSLLVTITNSDHSEAAVPATVLIPAFLDSVSFPIAAVNDFFEDGSQIVWLTASAAGYQSAATSFEVVEVNTWQNPLEPMDIDGNGQVEAVDALLVVNHINSNGPAELPIPRSVTGGFGPFLDPSGDNMVTPMDVMLVINFINIEGGAVEAEGESAGQRPMPKVFEAVSSMPRFVVADEPQFGRITAWPTNPSPARNTLITGDGIASTSHAAPTAANRFPANWEWIDREFGGDPSDSHWLSVTLDDAIEAFAASVNGAWK